MANATSAYTHSYQHFDNLQLSAKAFYTTVIDIMVTYEFPEVTAKPLMIREGNFLSAKREYLCILRDELEFNICAAPFGKSFFISWYLKPKRDAFDEFLGRLWIVGWLFRPAEKTFYQLDTELMFGKSVDAIVRAAIARVASYHGFLAAKTPGQEES